MNISSDFGAKASVFVFLVSMVFPYIQIIPSDGYTQPIYLIMGLLVALRFWRFVVERIDGQDIFALIWIFIVGLLLYLFSCFPYSNSQEYKYLVNYLSPIVLTFAVVGALNYYFQLVRIVIEVAIIIWFFVSLIQVAINPSFMLGAIGSWAEGAENMISSGRGVLGLAPEPTHHGFHVLLLGASLALLGGSQWLLLLCVIEALFFAKSASAFLVLIFGLVSLGRRRPYLLILFCVLILFWFNFIWILSTISVEDSRILSLLSDFFNDPLIFITQDYSVNMRIGGAYATLGHVFGNYFLPEGLSHDNWLLTGYDFLRRYDWLMDISTVGPPTGFGVLLFQAGFLVFPLIFAWIKRVLRTPNIGFFGEVLVYASPFVFLGQFYISSPMFSLLYGCAIYVQFDRQKNWLYKHHHKIFVPIPRKSSQ